MGTDNLGVGPVPVRVKAKGGDWTDESNTSGTGLGGLVGNRSEYSPANSELLSNTIDKGKVGDGPVPVSSRRTSPTASTTAARPFHAWHQVGDSCQSQCGLRRWPNTRSTSSVGAYANAL